MLGLDRGQFGVDMAPQALVQRGTDQDLAAGGEVLISPALHQRLWRHVDAELTAIQTKHEGTLSAYRLNGIRSPTG